MDYKTKENLMARLLERFKTPAGYRSSYKGVPIALYEEFKCTIDFTKYYVVFRGPRPRKNQCSTLKRDAKAFDIYQRADYQVKRIRLESEAFKRGVAWASN